MTENERAQSEDVLFERSIRSTLHERQPLIRDVLESLKRAGYTVDSFFDRLILDELITNAIVHGTGDGSNEAVAVRVERCGATWRIDISDQGEGFDWERRLRQIQSDPEPDPFSSDGRGLRLLHSLGVRVEYRDGGRRAIATRPASLNLCAPA